MKNFFTYLFIALLLPAILVSCSSKDEIPSLKETFSKSDKNPFGSFIAFEELGQLFYYNDIKTKKVPYEKSLGSIYDSNALYVTIAKNLFLTRSDREAMLAFVEAGNSMFISSGYYDTTFLNMVGLSLKQSPGLFAATLDQMKYTAVQLAAPYYTGASPFGYFYFPLNNAFAALQDSTVKILGVNEQNQPNFAVVFYGKGRFYLHCEPRVFSNYFLLQKNNYKYLQHAFSFIPAVPEDVFWDDYYNKRNTPPSGKEGGSGLSVLLQYPSMAWAFWLSLLLLLLYILFGSKRRQRIIKPIPPNENSTVAFTETVSRLYLQKKDNRNIADKMITYFYEHVRNQYYLNTNAVNEEFISTLSRKSNVPKEETAQLFNTISRVQQSETTADKDLLLLNHQIETFYKHNR